MPAGGSKPGFRIKQNHVNPALLLTDYKTRASYLTSVNVSFLVVRWGWLEDSIISFLYITGNAELLKQRDSKIQWPK